MKITVIVVGKLKSQFKEIDDFYQKRIKIYSQLEIIELKEKNDLTAETENIINTWGEDGDPFSFYYLGKANCNYNDLKLFLNKKKRKKLKVFKKREKFSIMQFIIIVNILLVI